MVLEIEHTSISFSLPKLLENVDIFHNFASLTRFFSSHFPMLSSLIIFNKLKSTIKIENRGNGSRAEFNYKTSQRSVLPWPPATNVFESH